MTAIFKFESSESRSDVAGRTSEIDAKDDGIQKSHRGSWHIHDTKTQQSSCGAKLQCSRSTYTTITISKR
jgi:hypothetical protein